MADLQTTNRQEAVNQARQVARAGSKFYAGHAGGSGADPGPNLFDSRDGAASWTKRLDLDTLTALNAVSLKTYQDASDAWHLAALLSGSSSATQPLKVWQAHGGVFWDGTGSAPDLSSTALTQLDAGGTNLGARWGTLEHTPTGANRRLWALYVKTFDNAGDADARYSLAYAPEGVSADNPANWTLLESDLGAASFSTPGMLTGVMAYGVSGASQRLLIVYLDPSGPDNLGYFLFDPGVASPAVGSPTMFNNFTSNISASYSDGGVIDVVCADEHYFVAFIHDPLGTVQMYKIPFTGGAPVQPSAAWQSKALGQLTSFYDAGSGKIYVLHTAAYGASASTEADLQFFTIDTATDFVSTSQPLTSVKGRHLSAPRRANGTSVPFIYRRDVASPYRVSGEAMTLAAPPPTDTTPPGQVTAVTATARTDGTTVDVTFTMPTDSDAAGYRIGWRNDGVDPDPNATNVDDTTGSSGVATPGQVVSVAVTGLTPKKLTRMRIFAKDDAATPNWNTGVLVYVVPLVQVVIVGFGDSNGVYVAPDAGTGRPETGPNPTPVIQMVSNAYEESLPAAHRGVFGLDQAKPPTVSPLIFTTGFEYETSGLTEAAWKAGSPGTWVNGDAGVPPAFQSALLRLRTTGVSGAIVEYFTVRPEQ